MKYYEKRKYLIGKIVLAIMLLVALFFAVSDCAPKTQHHKVVVTFERN